LAWCVGAVVAAVVAALATAPPPVPGLPTTSAWVDAGVSVSRVLLDGSITAVLGLGVVPLLFSPREQAVAAGVRLAAFRAGVWASLGWLLCALASMLLQAANVAGGSTLTASVLATFLTGFGSGQTLVGEVLAAALALAAAVRGARTGSLLAARLMAACAGLAVLLLVAAGHLGALSERWHDLAAMSLELHVLGAALWTGGLGALVGLLAEERALLSRALPRFSWVAGGCMALVALSGLLNALVALSTTPAASLPSDLFTTGYGRLVLAKVGCVCLLAVMGAQMRYRLLPRIVRAYPTAFALWASCELTVMGIAFGVAAVLQRSAV
jgi:copper resistance protein D